MMTFRLFSLLLIGTVVLADEARVVEHTWLTGSDPSGLQTTTYESDGTIRINFEYRDRGRGPNIESVLRLNQDGVPAEFSVAGNNYAKATVDERFVVEDGYAKWSSSVERGQSRLAENEFYFPHNESPEVLAILARALLNSEDDSIELLPGGRATIERVAEKVVEADGQSKDITLYGIRGLDLAPTYVWLDDQDELFAFTDRFFGMTPKGWESNIDVIREAEAQATEAFYQSMSADLKEDLTGLTAIVGARVFDSLTGSLTAPATVFVWDGKISAVYFEEVDIPEGARVVEAFGKTLMPALWDMHNHVRPGYFMNYLASGVTNVRDMGSRHDTLTRLIVDVRTGDVAGPDIHPLGFIDKRGEFAAPAGLLADNVDDALRFVDFYAQHGYHGIKLYSSIEPEWVAPIADYAHERGLRVMGHIPAYMNAEQAIRAGFDEINHINMLLLNFMGAEDLDTRTPARFLVPGVQAADLDLESDQVREFITLMQERGIAHEPTLEVFVEMFRNQPGEMSALFIDIADHLPTYVQRNLITGASYNEGNEVEFARSAETLLELVALLHENGIRILPGTDNILPGFTLIRELIYYVEAGIPTNEALQLGTIGPARYLGLDQRLGSITVGKDAHMYIVDGDPVQDISTLYRVEQVIKGRQMFYAPDILRAQGFVPFDN